MTTVGNPNLIAAAGLIIVACGLGLFGRAVLSAVSGDVYTAGRAAAKTRVDLAFAAPMLLTGIIVLAGALFVSSGITPMITLLLLSVAFALLIYALLEGSIVEALAATPAEVSGAKLKLIAPPPRFAHAALRASTDTPAEPREPKQSEPAQAPMASQG
jgi:hypothetical protein